MFIQGSPNELPQQPPEVSPQPQPAVPPAPPAPVQQPSAPADAPRAPASMPEGYVSQEDFRKFQAAQDRRVAQERQQFQAAAQEWQRREQELLRVANEAAVLKQQKAEADVIARGGNDADVQSVRLQFEREKFQRDQQVWQAQKQQEEARRVHEYGVATSIAWARNELGLADNEIPSIDQYPDQNQWIIAANKASVAKIIRERDEWKAQAEARQKPSPTQVSQHAEGEALAPEDRELLDLRDRTRSTGEDTLNRAIVQRFGRRP